MRNSFFKYLLLRGVNPASRAELETETLPYIFKSNSHRLRNYRIYGNTVNDESVGDLVTEGEHAGEYCVPVTVEGNNLFDFRKWSINVEANNGNDIIKNIDGVTLVANISDAFTTPYAYTHTDFYKINVKPNTTYVLSWSSNNLPGRVFVFKNGVADGSHRISVNNAEKKYLLFDTDMDTEFVTLRFGVTNAGDSITYSKIMLIEGSADLPYEPYHEPITTNIYLTAQLKIIGNETEYVDFKTQKQYFADGTSADVALTVLLTFPGTNTLSVGTQVQPSKIYLQGKISEAEIVSARSLQTNMQSLQPLSLDDEDLELDVMPTDNDLQIDVKPIEKPVLNLNDVSEIENAEIERGVESAE